MRNVTAFLFVVFLISTAQAQTNEVPSSKLPPGTKASYEVVRAPVLRVYAAEDDGYKFVAYVVKWKDTEIIVSDALARTSHQPGETIAFIAHKIHLDNPKTGSSISALNFQIVEPPAGSGAKPMKDNEAAP